MDREHIIERIEQLENAQQMIYEAQTIIDEQVEGMSAEQHYKAYGRYGIDQLMGNGNPYDSSIQSLIEELQNQL
tara:strand:+ start:20256 stop:20477 length:222 start_codon:yes stop_codon:yes gene_type:complete